MSKSVKKSNSSPYRYITTEAKEESRFEPNELVNQLKKEQDFEYASH